jgi:hypothetical protein
MGGNDGSKLIVDVSKHLAERSTPDEALRARSAHGIRERAATLYRNRHSLSRIDYAMSQVDHDKLRPLLEKIANVLSPETANDPVPPVSA